MRVLLPNVTRKERAARAGSDECIIAVVVAKCSSLIIPPSFANEAGPHLHINGGEPRVRCQGLRVKRVAKLWERRGHQPYNKQNPPASQEPPPSPTSRHPLCLSIINRRNRMADRLLFWAEWHGGGGGSDMAESSLSNQRVAPGLV